MEHTGLIMTPPQRLRRHPRARARVVVRADLGRPGAGAVARRGVRVVRRGGRRRAAATRGAGARAAGRGLVTRGVDFFRGRRIVAYGFVYFEGACLLDVLRKRMGARAVRRRAARLRARATATAGRPAPQFRAAMDAASPVPLGDLWRRYRVVLTHARPSPRPACRATPRVAARGEPGRPNVSSGVVLSVRPVATSNEMSRSPCPSIVTCTQPHVAGTASSRSTAPGTCGSRSPRPSPGPAGRAPLRASRRGRRSIAAMPSVPGSPDGMLPRRAAGARVEAVERVAEAERPQGRRRRARTPRTSPAAPSAEPRAPRAGRGVEAQRALVRDRPDVRRPPPARPDAGTAARPACAPARGRRRGSSPGRSAATRVGSSADHPELVADRRDPEPVAGPDRDPREHAPVVGVDAHDVARDRIGDPERAEGGDRSARGCRSARASPRRAARPARRSSPRSSSAPRRPRRRPATASAAAPASAGLNRREPRSAAGRARRARASRSAASRQLQLEPGHEVLPHRRDPIRSPDRGEAAADALAHDRLRGRERARRSRRSRARP